MIKSFSTFFISSVTASLMAYLFQVVIARKIGASEFSQFTLEWSYISIFIISGAFANYVTAFNPLSSKLKKILYLSLQVLALGCLGLYFYTTLLGWLSAAVVVENLMQGLLLGALIGQKRFKECNILNLLVGVSRLAAAFLLPLPWLSVPGLLMVVVVSFGLVHIFAYFYLRGLPKDELHSAARSARLDLLGPALLATLAAVIPQIDILWTSWFLNAATLVEISGLVLVSKAVFYVQMIFAQWLLPWQAQDFSSKLKLSWLRQIAGLVALLGLSVGLGVVAHALLPYLLHWTQNFSLTNFILIAVLGTLSALFYLTAQILSRRGILLRPAIVFVAVLIQALLQGWMAGWMTHSLTMYLAINSGAFLIANFILLEGLKEHRVAN